MRILQYRVALAIIILTCGMAIAWMLAKETPRGRVVGSLRTAERGTPLGRVRVVLNKDGASFPGKTDRLGNFAFAQIPVGDYRLIATTRAHQQPTQLITVHDGRTTRADVELQPMQPFLRIFQQQRVFTTSETPRLRCQGFAPTNELAVSIYRVSPAVAVQHWRGYLPDALTLHHQPLQTVSLSTVPELTKMRTLRLGINGKRDVEGIFRQEIALGTLTPGLFLVAVEALNQRALAVVTVTDLGMIVKSTPDEALIYTVGLNSNTPIAGAAIEARRAGKTVVSGVTDKDGLLILRLPKSEGGGELMLVGRAADSFAVATVYTYWHGVNGSRRVYTYTDRPVYRPGQQVHFKSLIRDLKDDHYQVPAHLPAQVRVVDPHDDVVFTGRQTADNYGAFAGDFTLSSAALPGSYTMTINIDGAPYETSFAVAEYRKPEFAVTVKPDRARYTRGETVNAVISAEYYYGAPVPRAGVTYSVMRSPYWYCDECTAWDEDLTAPMGEEGDAGGEYGGGEIIFSGQGTTDDNGKLTIAIPPKVTKKDDTDAGQDWRYVIAATVTDAGRRSQDGNGSTLVTQGDFRLSATPEDWMTRPGQQTTLDIHAVDYDGKPVANLRGRVTIAGSVWQDNQQRLTESARLSWQTDADGKARVPFTPQQQGDYRITCLTADGRGNRITAATSLWVMSGDSGDFNYPYQDIDVHADKQQYREGDTAQIVVNTRYAPITALLTIEGAKIFEDRLVKLTAKSTVIKVPIRPEFMPAARVSLNFLHGKRFLTGDARLLVSRDRKALAVKITPDKAIYRPGDKATYRIETRTPEQKPVAAEVSLGVVDEAIYAIAPDSTPDIIAYFYPKRDQEVQTAYSFPEIYLSGDDKAGTTIRTRSFFPDTAFWNPAVVTDAKGQATLSFTMPDNLTTWRATARAASLDTRVGQATNKVIVQKPFLVRLETPRFFTQGDRLSVTVVAHNLTANALTATVGIEGTGVDFDSARSRQIQLGAGQTQRVEWTATVPAPGNATVRAWGKAGALDDAMALTLPIVPKGRAVEETRAGSTNTGTDMRFVLRKDAISGTPALTLRLTPSLAGAMLGALDYLASYPYGCVEQTMSSFLPDIIIADLLKQRGLDNPALRQKLPSMVNAGLLKLYGFQHDDKAWGWWQYDKSDPWMTAYVVYGLQRAKEAGFAVNEQVLRDGLNTLLPMANIPGAKTPTAASTNWSNVDQNTRAFVAYVLAIVGERDAAGVIADSYSGPQHAKERATLNDWGRLMLARADSVLGRGDAGRALLEEEWTRYLQQQTSSASGWHWWSETDIGAALLSAGVALTPNDPRLPDLVRRLMEKRQANHWDSTRDTAAILDALSSYLRVSHELQPDLQVAVTVNGKSALTRHFTTADLFQPETTLTLAGATLGTEAADVRITATGSGRLYYTATLNQVVSSGLNAPVYNNSGLVIERRYHKVTPGSDHTSVDTGTPSETTFRSGDIIEVSLTLRSQRHLEFLLVEDPLPAGCEARDRDIQDFDEWQNWWCDQITRDRSVSFALRQLDPGVQHISYRMQALVPGRYTALPPRVFDMYHPDIFGSGPANDITVRP